MIGMSFLKRFFKKAKTKGKAVCDFYAKEVGEISNTRFDGEVQVYEVLMKDANLELSFPADQFFVDEDGKICLMPRWLFSLRVFCSKLQELKKKYDKINALRDTLTEESFLEHLTSITKSSVKHGEEIIEHLPKLEEYSIGLEKERNEVIKETSRLMALRLLESGRRVSASAEKPLTKKEYSLKIIELRRRYGDLSRLIRFMSELYDNTKTSISFLDELLGQVVVHARWAPPEMGVKCKEPHPSVTPDIQDLIKQAHNVYTKVKKITEILDGLHARAPTDF